MIIKLWNYITVDTLKNLSEAAIEQENKFYGQNYEEISVEEVKNFFKMISVNDEFIADEILNFIHT